MTKHTTSFYYVYTHSTQRTAPCDDGLLYHTEHTEPYFKLFVVQNRQYRTVLYRYSMQVLPGREPSLPTTRFPGTWYCPPAYKKFEYPASSHRKQRSSVRYMMIYMMIVLAHY